MSIRTETRRECTLVARAKAMPGWQEWALTQAGLDDADRVKLARLLGTFVDAPELAEAVNAVMGAGFHR